MIWELKFRQSILLVQKIQYQKPNTGSGNGSVPPREYGGFFFAVTKQLYEWSPDTYIKYAIQTSMAWNLFNNLKNRFYRSKTSFITVKPVLLW